MAILATEMLIAEVDDGRRHEPRPIPPNSVEEVQSPTFFTNQAIAASCIIFHSVMNNCLYFGLIRMLNVYSIA